MSKKILLIDDDVDFVEATRALLEAQGYAVCQAHNGKDGIATAKAEKPDLIVLDVMMTSDTEGFEVSRAVKESPELSGTPIILMTGIRRAMKLPFGFEPDKDWLPVKIVLEKPVPPERLLAEVARQLKAKSPV